MNKEEFKKFGGKWLGVAREWVQWSCKNGDRVIWGSNEVLQLNLTVRDFEDISGQVAYAAVNENNENLKKKIMRYLDKHIEIYSEQEKDFNRGMVQSCKNMKNEMDGIFNEE